MSLAAGPEDLRIVHRFPSLPPSWEAPSRSRLLAGRNRGASQPWSQTGPGGIPALPLTGGGDRSCLPVPLPASAFSSVEWEAWAM